MDQNKGDQSLLTIGSTLVEAELLAGKNRWGQDQQNELRGGSTQDCGMWTGLTSLPDPYS